MSRKEKVGEAIIKDLLDQNLLYKGDNKRFIVNWISSGIPDLDAAMGGGFPRGRFAIITGPYSSLKTFLVQMLMKSALEAGMQVAYIDTERTYEPQWWAKVGIPLDKVYVAQPKHGEAAADLLLALAKADIDVICIDSLAALIPMEEADSDSSMLQKQMALQARLISKMIRMLLAIDHRSAVIFTNQLRDTIGGPAPVDTMPGGRAQQFFASLILRTIRDQWIEEEGRKVGFHLKVIVRKNKVGEPYKECMLPFRFRGEIDMTALLLDRAINNGLVKQTGPWFTLSIAEEEHTKQGRSKMIELLTEREDLRGHLERALGGGDTNGRDSGDEN